MAERREKWSRLVGLSAWQWCVLGTAPLILGLTWLRLRTRGYGWTLAAAQAAGRDTAEVTGQLALARDTAYALAVAVKYGPWRPQCLLRSLALAWFLGRRGIPFSLRIGVPGGKAGDLPEGRPDFTAHAWVEHAGHVLNDREDVAVQFRPFDAG